MNPITIIIDLKERKIMDNKFVISISYKNLDTSKYSYTYTKVIDFIDDEKEAKEFVDWLAEVYRKTTNEKKK